MSKRALGFMNKSALVTYNTYIGGVSATISTASALATKLAISVGRITNFTIVGSDIKCKITGSYAIPANAFQSGATPCTYYTDSDYLVTSIGDYSFYYTTDGGVNFGNIDFRNVTTVGYQGLSSTKSLNISLLNCTSVSDRAFWHFTGVLNKDNIYIPNCTSLGSTSGNNEVFTGIVTDSIIYCHPSLATNNGGSPDGDIAYAISQGVIIRYVSNFTAPSPVTTLAAGTIYNTSIQLNFTAPSSTNTIDYYNCYANGVFKNKISGSGKYIGGLTDNSNYNITIEAVDIYRNTSTISNLINITTTNVGNQVDRFGLVAYYKLDETTGTSLSDSFAGLNLTTTGLSLNQSGKIGTSVAVTTASNYADNNSFPSIKENFTINMWCYRTGVNSTDDGIIDVGSYGGGGSGFGVWINNIGQVTWRINSNYSPYSSATLIALNTWVMVTVTCDGSNVKTYLNGTLVQTTANSTYPATSSTIRLFSRKDYAPNSWRGRMDETAIYDRGLTQTEIDLLYNSGNGITL